MAWGQAPQLPLDHDVVMYPRVSTPKQKGNVSSEMQLEEDGKLMQIALRCGWQPQQIRCPKNDMALSGRLKMEERPAFRQMLSFIRSGEVKAVIAVEVDRLFRDKFGAEYGKFIEICEQYGVLVICPDMVYDFRDMHSISRFRDRCIAAWEYLEYQIYGKMLGARDFLGRTCRYASGCTPVGYIVDQRQKLAKGILNPHYRKYVVYEPHAGIMLAIFRRFRELSGRLWQLYRELVRLPFVFPDFEDWVAAEGFLAKTNMKKVPGGYTIGLTALEEMLCNVAYMGYWMYKKVLISTASHTPIIPPDEQDLFWYAFNRRSRENPDGTPNEHYVGNPPARRYMQHGEEIPDAMLKYIISGEDPKYIINVKPRYNKQGQRTGQYLYIFVTSTKHTRTRDAKHMLMTTEVDGIFWQRLIAHLEQIKDFEAFASTEKQHKKELQTQRNEILAQIEACERAMKKLSKRLIQLSILDQEEIEGEEETDDEEDELVKDIRKEHKKFSAEKKRQEERLRFLDEEKPSYATQMMTYRELILEVREHIREYTTTEERQEIAEIFATKVTLNSLSPRVYKMNIVWRDTTWRIDEIIAIRQGNPSTWWTPENDKLLREHYATATRQELMRIFPDRPVTAIYRRASTLGLKKTKEDRESGKLPFAEDLSLMDYTVMEQYDLCWKPNQDEKTVYILEYPGGGNGGEHGVYFVYSCGRSGLSIENDAASYALANAATTRSGRTSKC